MLRGNKLSTENCDMVSQDWIHPVFLGILYSSRCQLDYESTREPYIPGLRKESNSESRVLFPRIPALPTRGSILDLASKDPV